MTIAPSDLAYVPFVSVDAMMRLVRLVGIERFLTELADHIRDDFLRWPDFDKTPRVASHSPGGVIELMPTADAELYASEQTAKARRVLADAESYATQVVATAINENGLEAAQYQIALKQVEALGAMGNADGTQTIVVPAEAVAAFGDAFKLLKGRGA